MKFFLGFVTMMVVLVIQDSMAFDDSLRPLDKIKPVSQLVHDKIQTDHGHAFGAIDNLDTVIHTSHGHAFGQGGNAGVGGVNNGNNGQGTGGSSGQIAGLNGYGGGNQGGDHSTFQGR